MRLSALIAGIQGLALARPARAGVDVSVTDITEDSRAVTPGAMFIARQGEKSDGRQFVPQALAAGASSVLSDDRTLAFPGEATLLHTPDLAMTTARLAERFFGEPSRSLRVLGVTGTNGKTTVTFLMQQMLGMLGIRCGLIGTVVIDDGVRAAPASMTTPSAIELSRTLARMRDNACRAVVMEVSSHALHQRRVGALEFAAGVFTNLTGDHLDYHLTMDNYADAKAMLFEMLDERAVGVVNADDARHTRMLRDCRARISRCRLATEGRASDGEVTARVLGVVGASTRIRIDGLRAEGGAAQEVRLPLLGHFNVMNALQALVSIHETFGPAGSAEVETAALLGALEGTSAPPGRLEPVTSEEEPIGVLVDYAHTDDALRTVLSTLRGAMADRPGPPGRLWCVFGCGGDRDRTKRPRMGRVARELADRVVVTSDNPRTEDPEAIIAEIRAGIAPGTDDCVLVEPDRERAIRAAIAGARPGDIVVIAGKGHEDYQINRDPESPGRTLRRHFDDREVARAALTELGIRTREGRRTPAHATHA